MNAKPCIGKTLLIKIRELIDRNRVRTTSHFQLREKQREIFLWEALHALKNGYHEDDRDEWDNKHQRWSYAIKGRTLDARELRIVVSILEIEHLLLITVYDMSKRRKDYGKKN